MDESSSLWKLTLEPGKLYKSQVNDTICVTKALLILSPGTKKSGIVQVQLIFRDEVLTVCSLSLKHGVLQASLDLCFIPSDVIGFTLSGTPTPVQLLGSTSRYRDDDDTSLSEDDDTLLFEDGEEEDFSDIDEDFKRGFLSQKKLQSSDGTSGSEFEVTTKKTKGLAGSKSMGSPSKKRKLSLDSSSSDCEDLNLEVVGTKAKIHSSENAKKKKKLSNGKSLSVETEAEEKTTKKALSVKGNKKKVSLKADKLASLSELKNEKEFYKKDFSKLPKLLNEVKSNEKLSGDKKLKRKLDNSATPKSSNDQKSTGENVSKSSIKKSTKYETGKSPKKNPKSGSEKSPKSDSEKSPKSGSEKSLKSGSEKSLKSGSEKSLKSGSEKSLKSGSEKSPKSGSEKSPKSGSEKSPNSGSEKSPKSGSEKSPKSGSEKSPKSGSEKSPKSGSEKSPKSGSEKSPKSGSEKSPKSGSEKSPKLNSEKIPKLGPKSLFGQLPESDVELTSTSKQNGNISTNSSQKSPNKADNTTHVLKGGVQAVDKSVGSGADVEKGKVVGVFYERYDGSSADASEKNTSSAPLRFHVGSKEVPRGLDVGVRGMKVGGKRTIVVPPQPGKKRKDEIRFEVTVVSCQ